MKFAAFGRTQFLYEAIHTAVARGHEAVLIGTCPAAPEYTVTEADFCQLAEELGCPFFNDARINRPEYVQMAKESGAEIALSLNWLTLIGETMLRQFKHGIVNSHAGDLPRFRGNACPNWAILAGEERITLTLHQMSVELDAGPIMLQRSFPIGPDTYVADIYSLIERHVPAMFVELLDGMEASLITPQEQPADPALSLRCFPRHSHDSQIDWTLPAEELSRLVRASSEPFSGAYTFLDAEKLIIWRAHSESLPYPHLGCPGQVAEVRREQGEVVILCGQGVLVIEVAEKEMAGRQHASRIIPSNRARLGLDVTSEFLKLRHRLEALESWLGMGENGT